jgi:L-ascorbate metabolism protein UlaG (beta-lactamase superfamily)
MGQPKARAALFASALILLLAASLGGQQAKDRKSDTERTSRGDLRITPLNHASFLMEWNGKTIFVDPVSQAVDAGLPKADLILITHVHGDHLDLKSINALKREGDQTIILAPEAVVKTVTEAKILSIGESKGVMLGSANVQIEAIAAYNLTRGPAPGQFYHPKGMGNGYILTLGGKRVYISGDTECIPEMKALKNIDIAFLCMNLPYTMVPQEAAECVKAFRPRIVYPYHYRGQDPQLFADELASLKEVEVRLRRWYP